MHHHRHARSRRLGSLFLLLVAMYAILAYLLAPAAWQHYTTAHPLLEAAPRITHTGSGIPGDPLNLALIGDERAIKHAFIAARWYPADPLTLKSCLEIAAASVLRRPYDHAPVSNLYLWKRRQDLAFEQPLGNSPRQRHHVRLWKSERLDSTGRPIWLAAASLDQSVGLSHTTGQITHHIAADIDAEREHVVRTLRTAGMIEDVVVVQNFQETLHGRNGGGDPWFTDGSLYLAILR